MNQIFSVVSFKKNDSPFQTHAPSLCVCVCTVHMKARVLHQISLLSFSTLAYETGTLTELMDHVLNTLIVHQAPGILNSQFT